MHMQCLCAWALCRGRMPESVQVFPLMAAVYLSCRPFLHNLNSQNIWQKISQIISNYLLWQLAFHRLKSTLDNDHSWNLKYLN